MCSHERGKSRLFYPERQNNKIYHNASTMQKKRVIIPGTRPRSRTCAGTSSTRRAVASPRPESAAPDPASACSGIEGGEKQQKPERVTRPLTEKKKKQSNKSRDIYVCRLFVSHFMTFREDNMTGISHFNADFVRA